MTREGSRLVDLHVHSTASDGTYPPREVVRMASEAGLVAMALADHDTVAGLAEAQLAGNEFGIEIVPATELSVEFPGGTMHILGYLFDPENRDLLAELARFARFRDERNPRIVGRLNELGLDLGYDDVLVRAGRGGTVSRLHIAQAMVDRGHVPDTQTAFDRYISRNGPAYVERRHVPADEVIRIIRDAGGLAVLAHPRQLRRPLPDLEPIVRELADQGLEGIETQHPEHPPDLAESYAGLARRLGLVTTGGSDYHGHYRSGVRIGQGWGGMRVPYAAVERMRERIAARGS